MARLGSEVGSSEGEGDEGECWAARQEGGVRWKRLTRRKKLIVIDAKTGYDEEEMTRQSQNSCVRKIACAMLA